MKVRPTIFIDKQITQFHPIYLTKAIGSCSKGFNGKFKHCANIENTYSYTNTKTNIYKANSLNLF